MIFSKLFYGFRIRIGVVFKCDKMSTTHKYYRQLLGFKLNDSPMKNFYPIRHLCSLAHSPLENECLK